MKTVEVLKNAKQKLKENIIDEREARLLLSYVLGIKNEDLIKYDEIDDETYKQFQLILDKRCAHIPYAYLVGHQEFMKLDFKVNENVLIPRADTEILVEEVINICKELNLPNVNILDMCTGSGCIAISLAKYVENADVIAVDISEEALKIAKENAIHNDVNVNFIKSDLFKELNETKFDLIVSNPPYIKRDFIKELENEVKYNEPIIALDGGNDGLDFYRRIIKDAKKYFNKDGIIAFEIGFDQGEEVKMLLEENGFVDVRTVKDYAQNDRVVIGRI